MGLGWVGTHRHAAAITRSRDFRLVGVIDRNGERARALGDKLNVPFASHADGVPDVPWLKNAAALTIATPPATHYRLVSDALAHGLHVLTEKPFAMHPQQGTELLQAANNNGRVLAICHNFQFSRSALRLAHDIDTGRLGPLRRIHAVQWSNPRRRLPSWYESLPGGLFYDESPHLLYLLRRFSPAPLALMQASVVPSSDGKQTPSLVLARYHCATTDGTLPVTLDMHFEAPLSEWHFSVIGEDAMGIIDVFRDIYIRLPNDGLHTTGTVLRSSLAATVQHWVQHVGSGWGHLTATLDYGNNEVYRRFAHGIRSGEPLREIDPLSALEVLQMQHAILHFKGGEQ
jgi:predicted dehydrogenase